jgi:hypothetical protein
MNRQLIALFILLCPSFIRAQVADTFLLKYAASKYDTIECTRIIRFDSKRSLYHVQDFYANGRMQMDAFYSSFDRNTKEGWQCNYRTNTKQGPYTAWHDNGQVAFTGNFRNGLASGRCRSWYPNGNPEADEGRRRGRLHGRVKYWTGQGEPEHDLKFRQGINRKPGKATYPYLTNLPAAYDRDTLIKWPLIIYLHGGSQRGTDLKKLYDSGIPDQVYRGRAFPFIIISPLGPLHLRFSTNDWFPDFFREITGKYRIDTTRIYLTGHSLGGNGTWYLAAKYPDRFAAIAPMSGFTSESIYIDRNIGNLMKIPLWAFHGKLDDVVPVEETERIIKRIRDIHPDMRYTAFPDDGHAINWLVYPGEDLYEWFLTKQRKHYP